MSIEQAYEERLEERRRYVRERHGSDLTDPQADYLAEAEAWREQRAEREQQEGIYEVAAALARGARGTSERGRHSQAYTPPRSRRSPRRWP